ncbi:BlaI/MecI/CopY family transcriptional regulator [Paramicrobacterium chengjingii]|uniref:BlaI/MecI/CopY family transcriptional regulator n=1 Tax=Paramicrobacterium chengjingii TaxID=2769067 RepID=A0ABX6YH96_9MICO|nr:BlaI/MecI/CopY family transcriptional regulator [Microbacterium chengjingii]QPZ37969.1 BlaI/MecI/CopY family transcriptional regulator [Microbacterium chengjingii]
MAGARTRERGELERAIMTVLWSSEAALSARDIQESLSGHAPAYTTVLTTLDRLETKQLVTRIAESPRKVRFSAVRSEPEQASHSMHSALADVGDRRAALLKFTGDLDDDDLAVLRDAIGAPRRKRRK